MELGSDASSPNRNLRSRSHHLLAALFLAADSPSGAYPQGQAGKDRWTAQTRACHHTSECQDSVQLDAMDYPQPLRREHAGYNKPRNGTYPLRTFVGHAALRIYLPHAVVRAFCLDAAPGFTRRTRISGRPPRATERHQR